MILRGTTPEEEARKFLAGLKPRGRKDEAPKAVSPKRRPPGRRLPRRRTLKLPRTVTTCPSVKRKSPRTWIPLLKRTSNEKVSRT